MAATQVNTKYVKLYDGDAKLLGITAYNAQIALLASGTSVKLYDENLNLLGLAVLGNNNAPDIRWIGLEDSQDELGVKMEFNKVGDKWQATMPDDASALQFPQIECSEDSIDEPPFQVSEDLSLDEYTCSTNGFPVAYIVRSDSNVGGVVTGE